MPDLTPEQAQFQALLQDPLLQPYAIYWDFEHRKLDLDAVKAALEVLSHGQRLMLQFLAGVWMGEDHFNFDFFSAVWVLDSSHQKIIQNWLSEPFWP